MAIIRVMNALECVADARRASTLLQPLRLRILEMAREPTSASDLARALRMPRQQVNYHVRALARARFLRRAGQRKKRNMIERRWVATARHYLVSPQVLGPVQADPGRLQDRLSAEHLLALASQILGELGPQVQAAADAEKRLSTLSITSALHFENPKQRAAFAQALERAVVDVVARFTSPKGRPYRLVVGCYPRNPSKEPS